jgi:hypothetical protein
MARQLDRQVADYDSQVKAERVAVDALKVTVKSGGSDPTTMAATGQLPNKPFVPTHWMPLRRDGTGFIYANGRRSERDWATFGLVPVQSPGVWQSLKPDLDGVIIDELRFSLKKATEALTSMRDEAGLNLNAATQFKARCDRLELELRRAGRKVPE